MVFICNVSSSEVKIVKQSSSVDPLKNVPASHLGIYFSLFSLSSFAPPPPHPLFCFLSCVFPFPSFVSIFLVHESVA